MYALKQSKFINLIEIALIIILVLLVRAGLSPKEKAEYDMKTKIGVAEALSKLELPRVVMAGGNTNSGGTAMDAMGLKMVSDLVDKMSN